MATPIELYTTDGVLSGLVEGTGSLQDALEAGERLQLRTGRMSFPDGSTVDLPASEIPVDDALLVVPHEAEVAVHAVWHDVRLQLGPWVVAGSLPTQPGFDPGRALARPGGTFLLIGEAAVAHRDDPTRVLARHERLLVNRYTVEAATASMMLGYFFPGARLEVAEPTAAGG